jgi:molybdopterin-guanine dinucleotide biosynthesis protein A
VLDGGVDEQAPGTLGAHALLAVLAGGRGRRIGGAKATRTLAGRPLIEHPLAAARQAGLEAVVVAKRDSELPADLAAPAIFEDDQPSHPLSGALAALTYAASRDPASAVVLVGCDMPFLTGSFLRWLADAHEGAVLIELEGRAQPLPARCLPEHAPLLRRALAEQASLREALRSLSPAIVDERVLARVGEDPRRLCLSVNSAEQLASAERLLRENPD